MFEKRKKFITGDTRLVYVIGVGGTGSFFAQGLAKMIAGYKKDITVILVDPDMIEKENCIRQNFWPYEIGQSKAETLAFRLNQQFGTDFGFSVEKGEDVKYLYSRNRLIVTCVDKVSARKHYKDSALWLDMGNGITTGQVIFGSTSKNDVLEEAQTSWTKNPDVGALPNSYHVANMKRLRDDKKTPNCAEHPFAEQGVFVNEFAAYSGLLVAHQILIRNQVSTPQIYFDIETGRVMPKFITLSLIGGKHE